MSNSALLKSHDIAIALKMVANKKKNWRQSDLAHDLLISQGEIAKSIKRLKQSGIILIDTLSESQLKKCLLYALPFMFPVEPGAVTLGVPTAISAPGLKKIVVSSGGLESTYIWPHSEGKVLGQSIKPLYKNLPAAALKDKRFYFLLSALDVVRTGRAREKKAATKILEKELS